MNSVYPLFRLFWRPGVLLDVVVTTVFAVMLSWMGAMVSTALIEGRGSLFGLLVEHDPYVSPRVEGLHFCLLPGAVIGVVANYAMQDLLYCRFSWGLPGLGARLRTGLWGVAALATGVGGAAGVVLGAHDLAPGPLQGAALGLAGFALGNQLWDRRIGSGICFASQVLLVAAVVGVVPLAHGIERAPWAVPVAAVLLVVFTIRRATNRQGLRRRALVPLRELGASFRGTGDAPLSGAARKAGGDARLTWTGGNVLDRRGWIRALEYEAAGWVRGSWRTQIVRVAVSLVLLVCAVNFALDWYKGGSVRGSLGAVAACIFDPLRHTAEGGDFVHSNFAVGVNFVLYIIGVAAIVIVLTLRLDLRRGVVYPLSRAERAAVVWWACLRQGLALLGLTVALLFLIGLAAAWFAGAEVTLHRLPETLVAAFLAALGLPILQGARLRLVDSGRVSVNSLTWGALVGTGGILFLTGLKVVVSALREVEPATLAVVVLGIVPVLWVIAQLVFRGLLRSWFASTDLA